jgi:hypothetical protein
MRSRVWTRWALPAFAVILVAAVITSVFRAGSSGVESAESAARIPIPSRQTVHLEARGYTVSFAVYNSLSPGVRVPQLQVSIARADTGERLELRKPTKRYLSASNGEQVVDQYLITVRVAGMYDVWVTADEQTDGFLLIGDRPIDALGRVFKTWVILAVAGSILSVAIVVLVIRRKLTLSVAVRVNRRTLTPYDGAGGPADPE